MYDAVVFDNDGVLTELTDRAVLRGAVRETFAGFGVDPDDGDVETMLSGVTVDALRRICGRYDLHPEEFWYCRDTTSSAAQRRAIRAGEKPLYDDVAAVRELDLPLGIVSSNQQATVDCIVEHFGLGDRFEVCYGRQPTLEHVRKKKPEPYFLERALADLAVDDALDDGDSETDVIAAREAGLDAAFVRRPHRRDYDLSVEPTYEIDGLDALADVV